MSCSVVRIVYVGFRKLLFENFHITLISDFNYLTIVNRNVTHTVIEIVAGCEHIVVNSQFSLRRHIRCCKLACGLVFPVFINLVKDLLILLADVERVCLTRFNRVEFSFKPLK